MATIEMTEELEKILSQMTQPDNAVIQQVKLGKTWSLKLALFFYRLNLKLKLSVEDVSYQSQVNVWKRTAGYHYQSKYVLFQRMLNENKLFFFLCVLILCNVFCPPLGYSPAETGFQKPSHYTSPVCCHEWIPKSAGIVRVSTLTKTLLSLWAAVNNCSNEEVTCV